VMRPSMVRINLSGEAVSIPRPRPTPFGWLLANRAAPQHRSTCRTSLYQVTSSENIIAKVR